MSLKISKREVKLLSFISVVSVLIAVVIYTNILEKKEERKRAAVESAIYKTHKKIINEELVQKNYQIENAEIELTLNSEWQGFLQKLLKRNSNYFTSITVIDNNTGEIIGLYGKGRGTKESANNLLFSATHPAASLFKIVSSAELMNNQKIEPETKFSYRGRGTTLYKYQLKDKITKWSRKINFKRAFALSNNVIFGKAAIKNTNAVELTKMADSFGFNRDILTNLKLKLSQYRMAESQYQLAEIASGFNKKTLTTPIHAAFLSHVIATDSPVHTLSLIKGINLADEKIEVAPKRIVSNIDQELRDDVFNLMEYTVQNGTARSLVRRMRYKTRKKYSIGAKTGSITGGIPAGKREWLTFFVQPNDKKDKGISVSVMNIYDKKWYQKPSYFGRKVINFYTKSKDIEFKRLSLNGSK